MKKKLLAMLKAKEEARTALVAKSVASEDVAELRSINTQLEGLNAEITELRTMIDGIPAEQTPAVPEGQSARTLAVKNETPPLEQRTFTPGTGFTPVAGADFTGEKRSKEEIDAEKRGIDLLEKRAVTVGSAGILLATQQATTIGPNFNQISSLIDRVTYQTLTGGESFTQSFLIDNPAGDYSNEGDAYTTADTTFGNVSINKTKITAYSESTEEILKLPAAPYEAEVMGGITKSVHRKITREILIGTGATNHLAGIFSAAATTIDPVHDLSLVAINTNTLDEIIFSFGGDEDVEDQAVLILNKVDVKAFSQLRTADGTTFHTIVTHGNTGTIDGIPYIINSACKAISNVATAVGAYSMAYGPMSNYKLVVFSDLDVQRSTDFKFATGQIAHRGSIFVGGNVVAQNGFLRVKKVAAV